MSSTAKIFAAITLAIPTGDTHMIASTILMITWRNCDVRDIGISGSSFHLIDCAKNGDKLLSRAAQGAQDSSKGKAEEYHSESVCSWPE